MLKMKRVQFIFLFEYELEMPAQMVNYILGKHHAVRFVTVNGFFSLGSV